MNVIELNNLYASDMYLNYLRSEAEYCLFEDVTSDIYLMSDFNIDYSNIKTDGCVIFSFKESSKCDRNDINEVFERFENYIQVYPNLVCSLNEQNESISIHVKLHIICI